MAPLMLAFDDDDNDGVRWLMARRPAQP